MKNIKSMKNYSSLFQRKGFEFNGQLYNNKSYTEAYYELVKDVLDQNHGTFKNHVAINKAFGKTIYLNYNDMPSSVKNRKLYKKLGDIYVLRNKDIKGFNSAIQRIGKALKVEVEIN